MLTLGPETDFQTWRQELGRIYLGNGYTRRWSHTGRKVRAGPEGVMSGADSLGSG